MKAVQLEDLIVLPKHEMTRPNLFDEGVSVEKHRVEWCQLFYFDPLPRRSCVLTTAPTVGEVKHTVALATLWASPSGRG